MQICISRDRNCNFFASKWMHAGLNLCIFSEIYESEIWDMQVDGSLHVGDAKACSNLVLNMPWLIIKHLKLSRPWHKLSYQKFSRKVGQWRLLQRNWPWPVSTGIVMLFRKVVLPLGAARFPESFSIYAQRTSTTDLKHGYKPLYTQSQGYRTLLFVCVKGN